MGFLASVRRAFEYFVCVRAADFDAGESAGESESGDVVEGVSAVGGEGGGDANGGDGGEGAGGAVCGVGGACAVNVYMCGRVVR